jgi:5-methylcytosine-specific restriction endonuclease McrA
MAVSTTGKRSRSRPSGKYLARIRLAVYSRDGFACLRCGWAPDLPDGYDGHRTLGETYRCPRTGNFRCRLLELDHIHPHVLGGKFRIENLQTLCNSCNARKGAKV